MNERLRARGIEAGRKQVETMAGSGLLADFEARRLSEIRDRIVIAAYKGATAVLEEEGGHDAEDFLAGFLEGASAAFDAMRARIANGVASMQ